MAENSENMTRRLTDAIGRDIAKTLNAGEVNSITYYLIQCKFSLELMNIYKARSLHDLNLSTSGFG